MQTRTFHNHPPLLLAVGLLVVALGSGGIASALPPDPVRPDPESYARAGQQVWSNRLILAASNTRTDPVLTNSAGDAPPACFGWGTMLSVQSLAEATCCLSLTSSVALGDQTTTAANTLTVTGEQGGAADGKGACITFNAGERWTMVPRWETWYPRGYNPPLTTAAFGTVHRSAPGRRTGICSAYQSPVIDAPVTPFCRNGTNGDCTEAGVSGGTCSTIDTQAELERAKLTGCAYLVCRGNAANADINVTIER